MKHFRRPTRVRNLFILLIPSLLACAVPVRAQSDTGQTTLQQTTGQELQRSSDPETGELVKTFLKDEEQIWTRPFRRSSYEGGAFSKYVLPFTLITGALVATDHRTANLLPNTTDQGTWSRRVSQIGAPYTVAGMAGAIYLMGRATHSKKAREAGFLGAEAIAHSQIVTLILKSATQRERPLDFQMNQSGGLGFGRGGNSFPSGHASGSFALATVFAYEYGGEHRWVPFASYGLATVVAASRLSAQQHWTSDIFVGSTMGFLIGRYVYKSHHDPLVDGELPKRSDRLIPQFGVTAHSAAAVWHW